METKEKAPQTIETFLILRTHKEAVREWLFSPMPVPLYLSGVVIIFAFLDLGKNISFSDSLQGPSSGDSSRHYVILPLTLQN
jgi:hypothetical protein